MRNRHTRYMYKRFVITLPRHFAAQANTFCETGGFSYSDFFCTAALAYLAAKSCGPQCVTPIGKDELMDNPFHIFSEWNSTADCVYDILG